VTLLPLTAGETMGNKKNSRKKKTELWIETAQTALDESEDANLITPLSHPLAKAIKLSLGWKPNKRRGSEKPYEIQEHLATAYKERSIQEVLFDGRMSDEVKNNSVAIKLFLFILCAFFSGLPVYKQSEDFYETISKAWGRLLTKSELQEVCRTAVDIFLKDTMSKHGLGDSKLHKFDKLTHAIIASFQWQPGDGHHHPLKQHLELHYAETTICEYLFGKQQKPSDWSLETKLFLFGLRATFVALPGKPSEAVARAFGTNAAAIDRIDITNLMQELVESSVSVLGTHTSTSTPKETNMSAVVSPGPEYTPQHRHEENSSLPVVSPCQEMPRSGFRVGDKEYTGIDAFPQEILNALKDAEGNINLKMNFSGTVEEMRAMLEVLTYKVLQSKETKCFSTVTVPAKSRKPTKTIFVKLPNAEKGFSALQQASKKRKANLVKDILEHLASASKSEADETELLKEVVKMYDGIVVMKKEDLKFSMPEVLALRHMLKCSANTLVKIDQFERMAKGNTRFPTQLKKKLAQAEKEGTFESEKMMIELQLNAKGETKSCLFWQIKDTLGMLQQLCQSLFLSGDFQQSSEFSRLNEKIVVVFGCDKDTEQTSMLMRTANRTKGNAKEHCMVLALYEDGDESHGNLQKTIYKEGNPIVNFLQLMLDNKLFMFNFSVTDVDGNHIKGQSKGLNLFQYQEDMEMPEVKVNITRMQDTELQDDEFETACERTKIDSPFASLDLALAGNNITIRVEMVSSAEVQNQSLDDRYIGFQLYATELDDPFYCQQFEEPIVVGRLMDREVFDCNAMQVIGFISCDMKQSWAVGGQAGSASAHCNCITCIQPKDTYITNTPNWMATHCPNNDHFRKTANDPPLREREFSNSKMFDIFKGATLNGQYRLTKQEENNLKKYKCHSIVKEPLMRVPTSKQTCGIMHGPHGNVGNWKSTLITMLREVDMEEPSAWWEQVEEVENDCTAHDEDRTILEALLKSREFRDDIKFFQRKIRETNENADILVYEMEIKELEDARTEHAETSGLGRSLKLQKGAKFTLMALKSYKSKESKKPRGEAEYAFIKAIEATGASFSAHNGGKELSHADGLQMIQEDNLNAISYTVCSTYQNIDEKRNKVKQIMEESLKVVAPLRSLCELMKSQQKWTGERIEKYKDLMIEYFLAWRKWGPNKTVFPKLHDMMRHVPEFVGHWKMYGILSEESFESNHQNIKAEMRNLKSMPDTNKRADALVRRLQIGIKPQVESIRSAVKSNLSGPKRGPYNVNQKEDAVTIQRKEREEDGDILYINKETAIKKSWVEVYDLCVLGRVPDSWHRVFVERDDIGAKKKEQAKYTANK
jgi:hypothetical protein